MSESFSPLSLSFTVEIMRQRVPIEIFFGSKGGIKRRWRHAHRCSEVRDRRPLISVTPEQTDRRVKGAFPVQGAGASPPAGSRIGGWLRRVYIDRHMNWLTGSATYSVVIASKVPQW